MSDDLVKRLRATTDGATVNPDGQEAADRIAELEAALDFYAKPENYRPQTYQAGWGLVDEDCGKRARAALEGGKKDA